MVLKSAYEIGLKKRKKQNKIFRKNYQNVFKKKKKKKKTEGLTRTCKSGVLIGKLPKRTIYTYT